MFKHLAPNFFRLRTTKIEERSTHEKLDPGRIHYLSRSLLPKKKIETTLKYFTKNRTFLALSSLLMFKNLAPKNFRSSTTKIKKGEVRTKSAVSVD